MNPDRTLPWDWYPGRVPDNVQVHETAYLETSYSFQLCTSQSARAVDIGQGSSIYLGVMFDLGEAASVRIGRYVLMNGARLICDSQISIGDYCLISWNVVLMDSYRVPITAGERRTCLQTAAQNRSRPTVSPPSAKPISIGSNVWIGFDCCVLPGVTIGEGSIIGARSVVTGDVPPFTIAVGNP